ncbi:MAG TPA: VWA domain-containing protein [Brevefilum sp.]|nr:VWA domain-containing protein [Brevefilum sp.]HPL70058.1 VWA domain-containing protein [Brevefilum sp.]
MKIKYFLIIIITCVSIFSFIPVSGYAQAQSLALENIAVVFVVDDSGSMASTDPYDLRYTAVKLMISSLDLGDKVGFVRFATTSSKVTDGLVRLSSEQDKQDLLDLIQPVEPYGYTDFKAGFEDARALLNSESLASFQKVVIFLTDGDPQIPNPYSGYLKDVMSVANSLEVPIYAIGLTPAGQTAILANIASETSGELIPANTANDLVDSFLHILGQLKDRTVIRPEERSDERSFNFYMDQSLVPYISKISFVASHTSNMLVRLISPSGEEVVGSDPSVSFLMDSDPSFTVLTIDAPENGDWQLIAASPGEIQARAILRSRLRTTIISPQGLVQAGKPALIVANVIEEMKDGALVKVVGDAAFSAEIILPDGSRQSLDRFYDDGTHGDQLADDGNFSREFVDTQMVGTYVITLTGKKGLIPVSTYRTFSTIEIPSLQIVEPRNPYYEIRIDPIPMEFVFESSDQPLSNFEGELKLILTDPTGKTQTLDLGQSDERFSTSFMPTQDGKYSYRIDTTSALIRGITLDQEIAGEFEVKIIQSIKVEGSFLGFGEPLPDQRFEIGRVSEGIPLTIKVSSTSSQDEAIHASVVQLPGFDLLEKDAFTVNPGMVNTIALHLKGSDALKPGIWNGFIQLSPASNVDVPEAEIPVSFELYQKTITFSIDQVNVECGRLQCFKVESISVLVDSFSNSDREEIVIFSLDGLPNLTIINPKQYISAGASKLTIELDTEPSLQPGIFDGIFQLSSETQKMALINEKGGSDLRFTIKIPGMWERCNKLIFLGAGSIFALVVIISLGIKKKKRARPLVLGSLIYWNGASPEMKITVDLNEYNKRDVTVGSTLSASEPTSGVTDIRIADSSLQNHHLTIHADREGGELLLSIIPVGNVNEGFRIHTDTFYIEENHVYSIGQTEFKIIFDPNR